MTAAQGHSQRPPGSAHGRAVLLVFDSASVRETVSVVDLGGEFEISVCDGLAKAPERAAELRPQLVAICAPGDHKACCAAVRAIKAALGGEYVPVAVLPVRAALAEMKDALDAGADDSVPISMPPEVVSMRLRSLLRAKSLFDLKASALASAEGRVKHLAKANFEAADLVLQLEESERRIAEQNAELERALGSLANANAEAGRLVLELNERDRRISEQSAEIARHLKTLQDELAVASALQVQLLPPEDPKVPGVAVYDRFIPATELCGDYYDYLVHPNGLFDIVIADVTGHGVAPALVALQVRALTRAEAKPEMPPARLLELLNGYMVESFKSSYLMSLLYLRYDPSSGRATYAGAGHNPFAVADPDGSVRLLRSQGTLLGVRDDFEYSQDTLELTPGQRLLLYTDGLIEVFDAEGRIWGYDGLRGALAAGKDLPAREVLDRVLREALYHGGNGPILDDITMILMERNEGASS